MVYVLPETVDGPSTFVHAPPTNAATRNGGLLPDGALNANPGRESIVESAFAVYVNSNNGVLPAGSVGSPVLVIATEIEPPEPIGTVMLPVKPPTGGIATNEIDEPC